MAFLMEFLMGAINGILMGLNAVVLLRMRKAFSDFRLLS